MPEEFNSSDREDGEGYIFAVVMITFDMVSDSMSIEPVGVCSTLKKALAYSLELEDLTERNKNVELTFDVLEFKIDESPFILDFLRKRKSKVEKDTDEAIIKLMKTGIVDQLVGEDGNFYYTLTEKGKDKIKGMNLPKYISKLFKKKND
jgi:fibronectin type 3 domain-containing protein